MVSLTLYPGFLTILKRILFDTNNAFKYHLKKGISLFRSISHLTFENVDIVEALTQEGFLDVIPHILAGEEVSSGFKEVLRECWQVVMRGQRIKEIVERQVYGGAA